MATGITTYCPGFTIKTKTTPTTKDIAIICTELEKKFGGGYKFRPEAISEGGIIMEQWPNKTMRITFSHWPFITQDTYEKWKTEDPKVIHDMMSWRNCSKYFFKSIQQCATMDTRRIINL